MQASETKTVTVIPPTGDVTNPGSNPSLLHKAAKIPLRVVVRNVSAQGNAVFIAYSNAAAQNAPSAPGASFELPAGASETFVLLPGESLYGITAGGNGRVSMAISVAFPFEVKA